MKSARFAIAAAAALALLVLPAAAADDTQAKTAQEALHTAQFKVAELDADLAKALVKALIEVEGIVSAKPDMDAGLFAVTFDPSKVEAKKLQTILREVSDKVALEKVGPADPKAAHGDCGKCPHHATCDKKETKDG